MNLYVMEGYSVIMGVIDNAFGAIKRYNFLPDYSAADAQLDVPLPIGFGQTNSQPTTVKRMLG